MESEERTALDNFYTGITFYRFCSCKLDSIITRINWLKLRKLREARSRVVFAAGLRELPEMHSHCCQGEEEILSKTWSCSLGAENHPLKVNLSLHFPDRSGVRNKAPIWTTNIRQNEFIYIKTISTFLLCKILPQLLILTGYFGSIEIISSLLVND